MRIIGHMVTRNELVRYLRCTLPLLESLCDWVVVYDDQSDDGSFEFARTRGIDVVRRPDNEPSFADDESWFRQQGWWEMERLARPEPGDWILCVDADEILCNAYPLHTSLEREPASALTLPVDEVFGFDDDGAPLIRRDGFWGQITATRLVRVEGRPSIFAPKAEGGGSVPAAWSKDSATTDWLRIVHFGYARQQDRIEKHQRYVNGRGHNPSHVASILRRGDLTRWETAFPAAVR